MHGHGWAVPGKFRDDESAYFPPDALPELAMEKNTPEQVQMCFDAYSDPDWKTVLE